MFSFIVLIDVKGNLGVIKKVFRKIFKVVNNIIVVIINVVDIVDYFDFQGVVENVKKMVDI